MQDELQEVLYLKQHIITRHPLLDQLDPSHSRLNAPSNEKEREAFDEDGIGELCTGPEVSGSSKSDTHHLESLRQFAAISVCRLKADVSLTDTKVSQIMTFCEAVVDQINGYVSQTVAAFMDQYSTHIGSHQVVELQNSLLVDNIFNDVSTPAKQRAFLNKTVGTIPEPRTIMLKEREGIRFVKGKEATVKVIVFFYVRHNAYLMLFFRFEIRFNTSQS